MAFDPVTTKLMTLLNVSAARPDKRKKLAGSNTAGVAINNNYQAVTARAADAVRQAEGPSSFKKRKAERHAVDLGETSVMGEIQGDLEAAQESDSEAEEQPGGAEIDAFDYHFASEGPSTLSELAKVASSSSSGSLDWASRSSKVQGLGSVSVEELQSAAAVRPKVVPTKPHAKVLEAYNATTEREGRAKRAGFVKELGSYRDVLDTRSSIVEEKDEARRAVALHSMSHIVKNRRRILRNNERLAKAASSGQSLQRDVRDQGFTRPKVLILAPLRNSALAWMSILSSLSTCPQIENNSRFRSEYSLPAGAVDKLTQPGAQEKYAKDHIETFKGNIDDSFRIGAKLTRKSWKLFSNFYESDVIVASPLGLRLAIEGGERDSDFLSSIEILIVDQMDVMTMQNWDHVQFCLSKLNAIPKKAHDTDFSRVKQWYLDEQARFFRQTILLSAYDAPEFRQVYRSLTNLDGKLRTVASGSEEEKGVLSQVRKGLRQSFNRFDCANANLEPDLRLQTFLQRTLPYLQKSAQSSSHTLIFVPSYFDYMRLIDALRRRREQPATSSGELSYTSLSEYSSGKEISKAREAFFSGKKRLLIVTERFHFYRRYVLRGARTAVFYGLPDHKQFWTELLEFPFVRGLGRDEEEEDEEPETDPTDVNVLALFSRFDFLRLERIVGGEMARKMCSAEETKTTWRFA